MNLPGAFFLFGVCVFGLLLLVQVMLGGQVGFGIIGCSGMRESDEWGSK
jgi:hypothetical protein